MLVKCTNCNGKGRIPFRINEVTLYNTCTICKGIGKLNIPDDKELCPDCNGSGSTIIKTAGLSFKSKCEKCNATGFIDK